jgi:hypothetical protein
MAFRSSKLSIWVRKTHETPIYLLGKVLTHGILMERVHSKLEQYSSIERRRPW